MKRYVVLVGGSGARMADALLCAASAGVLPAHTLNVLLADTAQRSLKSASLAAAQMADYDRVHTLLKDGGGAFRTPLRFSSWPAHLPGDASTLQQWTASSEEDAFLCQALLDEEAATLDLRQGFHGRRMLGQVAFAGLLQEADQNPDDPLSCMVEEMAQAIDEGDEVRVVLMGSICGGTGAAGIPLLARHIQERTGGGVHMGAVLLGACTDQEDAARARAALMQYAQEGLCDAVCVLGLPRASRISAPQEYARLTDWLAVYCMDVLLNRPQWLQGVFTVRAEEGAASWSIFGKAAQRYRTAYGRLMKAAAAWTFCIGPVVEARLERPMFLRDSLFGWYAHFFRRLQTVRGVQLEDAACLTRLMGVALLWLGGVCKTLPFDMRHAADMHQARVEATQHYQGLTELVAHLSVLDESAQQAEQYEDSFVHRTLKDEEEDEALETMRRVDAVRLEIARRTDAQRELNRTMGGDSVMHMLDTALALAEAESDELRERHAEANRRIDHAQSIARPEDQHRIIDARTKLLRMERHQRMVDERVRRIREDRAAAQREGVRFDKPELTPTSVENAMFLPDLVERLLQRDRITRSDVEALWGSMVLPAGGVTLKQVIRELRHAPVDAQMPVMSLFAALMAHAMEEE